MKKIVVLVLVIVISLLTCSCNKPSTLTNQSTVNESSVEPRLVKASFLTDPFNRRVQKSDLIAEVEIKEKLGEDQRNFQSYFRAELFDVYKNANSSSKKEINVAVAGTSLTIMRGMPIFKIGDRLILYLQEMEEENPFDSKRKTYCTFNAMASITRLSTIDNIEYAINIAHEDKELLDIEEIQEKENIKQYIKLSKEKYEIIDDVQPFKKETFVSRLKKEIELQELKK